MGSYRDICLECARNTTSNIIRTAAVPGEIPARRKKSNTEEQNYTKNWHFCWNILEVFNFGFGRTWDDVKVVLGVEALQTAERLVPRWGRSGIAAARLQEKWQLHMVYNRFIYINHTAEWSHSKQKPPPSGGAVALSKQVTAKQHTKCGKL